MTCLTCETEACEGEALREKCSEDMVRGEERTRRAREECLASEGEEE